MNINILFPVLNEEQRLKEGIEKTNQYMEQNSPMDYILTIVDNGSTDETENISLSLCNKYKHVNYIKTSEKGVGTAFREGVSRNTCDIVGYMDVDLSTDLKHLMEVINIFESDENVLMVNGSRLNKASKMSGRKWYRSLTSRGLTLILKLTLRMKASDSICGFKFYRKDFIEDLIEEANSTEKSWFYIIELLIRAERNNAKIVELPLVWMDDINSTVNTRKLIKHYLQQIHILRKKLRRQP